MVGINGNFHEEVDTLLARDQPARIVFRSIEEYPQDPATGKQPTWERFLTTEILLCKARLNGYPAEEFGRLTRIRQKGSEKAEYHIEVGECDRQGNPIERGKLIASQTPDGTVTGNMVFAWEHFEKVAMEAKKKKLQPVPETETLIQEIRDLVMRWEPSFGIKRPRNWEIQHAVAAALQRWETKKAIGGDLIEIKRLVTGRIRLVEGFFAKEKSPSKKLQIQVNATHEFGAYNEVPPATREQWEKIKTGVQGRFGEKITP